MNLKTYLLAGLLALSVPGVGVQAAVSVAMLTDVAGKVTVREGTHATPATILAYLPAGAELVLESGARLTVTLFAKPVALTLTGPARALVTADDVRVSAGQPAQTRSLVAAAVSAAQRFEPQTRDRLTIAAVEMRGVKPTLRILAPAGPRVLSTTPEIRWTALQDAEYQFALSDSTGKAVVERSTRDPVLTLDQPLLHGASYTIRVTAKTAGGMAQSVESGFAVAGVADARTLEAAKPRTGADYTERVLYAARLDAEGYRSEATKWWRALAAERPDDETLQTLAKQAR